MGFGKRRNHGRDSRPALHPAEFIETRRHWFSDTVPHDTGVAEAGDVNVINLVQGEEAGDPQGFVRTRGLAWFPRLDGNKITWDANPRYTVRRDLVCKPPGPHAALGLRPGEPIWKQYLTAPKSVHWVAQPDRAEAVGGGFGP